MDPNTSDPLTLSQTKLFTQIKRSHRIFSAQLYVSVLYIFPLLGIFLFIEPIVTGDELLSEISPMIPILAMLGFLAIKQIKATYSFFRASTQYFSEIEYATQISQISIGLTSYVTHLSKVLSPPTFLSRAPPSTLPERLDHIQRHLKKGLLTSLLEFIVSGMVVAGAVTFSILAGPEVQGQFLFNLSLSGFFIVPGIRLYLFLKWRPIMRKWLLGFQEIQNWGEHLEQLFLQQTEGGQDQ